MPANSRRGIHRCNDLNSFKRDEFEVVIIETFVADDLLQKGNQLNRVVLIRLRQIDIFEVDDQP